MLFKHFIVTSLDVSIHVLRDKLHFLINFYRKHKEYLSSSGNRNSIQIDKLHHDTFHDWFNMFVAQLVDNGEEVSEEIQTLAEGPLLVARSYGSYTINGYNFHTKSYDADRPTQSSGVALVSEVSGNEKQNILWCDKSNFRVRLQSQRKYGGI